MSITPDSATSNTSETGATGAPAERNINLAHITDPADRAAGHMFLVSMLVTRLEEEVLFDPGFPTFRVVDPRIREGGDAVIADKTIVAVAPVEELETSDHPWIKEYFLGPRGRAAHKTPARIGHR